MTTTALTQYELTTSRKGCVTTASVPKSGVAGVRWRAERELWEAHKTFMGRRHYLGRHKTLEAAKAAVDAWKPTAEDLARAATPIMERPTIYAPQPLHADGFPTLGRSRLTDAQVAYALSIAHELRGF